MVDPKPCFKNQEGGEGSYGWDGPLLTFTYPASNSDSPGESLWCKNLLRPAEPGCWVFFGGDFQHAQNQEGLWSPWPRENRKVPWSCGAGWMRPLGVPVSPFRELERVITFGGHNKWTMESTSMSFQLGLGELSWHPSKD